MKRGGWGNWRCNVGWDIVRGVELMWSLTLFCGAGGGKLCVGDFCEREELSGLRWRGSECWLGGSLSVCEERWLICGGANEGACFAEGGPLSVSDLGGLRLGGGDVLFFKCDGLQGKKLINVGTGLW